MNAEKLQECRRDLLSLQINTPSDWQSVTYWATKWGPFIRENFPAEANRFEALSLTPQWTTIEPQAIGSYWANLERADEIAEEQRVRQLTADKEAIAVSMSYLFLHMDGLQELLPSKLLESIEERAEAALRDLGEVYVQKDLRHPESWSVNVTGKESEQAFNYLQQKQLVKRRTRQSWSLTTHGANVALALVRGASETTTSEEPKKMQPDTNRVFVVHGHNHGLREKVARVLEKMHLKPIILSEQPGMGQTIMEKLHANSDVGFAVVILTDEDVGKAKADAGEGRPRARQNVILELGFFIGKLGRERVAVLMQEGIEPPSDILGVEYIPVDAGDAWKYKMGKELKAAGFPVDLNHL